MHGGDIYRNEVNLDYSVNTNPAGMPAEMKDALIRAVGHLEEYPDPEQEALRNGIAEQLNDDAERIIPGNGASEIFMAVRHALQPRYIFLTAPSFSGYAYVSGGCDVTYHYLKEENGFRPDRSLVDDLRAFSAMAESGEEAKLAFLACPNNPNGAVIPLPLLKEILGVCEEENIFLILDECFVDFCESAREYHDFMRGNYFPHLIRVGAHTKIYSIPGVRLGYAIVQNPELRGAIRAQLPEWNTSAFAQAAGSCRFDSAAFKEKTRRLVGTERRYLAEALEGLGIQGFPSDTNYLLIKTEIPLYEKLLEKGILIRNCEDYPGLRKGFYRIAVRQHQENEQLIEAIRGLMEQG